MNFKQFNKIKNLDISKQILFENIHSNKNFSPSLGQLIASLFLLLLSIIGIFISKIRRLKKIHYFILPINSNFPYNDKRSEQIFSKIKKTQTVNLVKSISLRKSLLFFLRHPNTIFFYSLFDIILYVKYRHSVSKKINFINFHKSYYLYKLILKKIFKFLKIKKLITIDDHRTACFFQEIGHEINMTTIAYMHGKFNKHQIGLKLNTFDFYILWDEFFKKQLLRINKAYLKKSIIYIKHPNLKKIKFKKKREPNLKILYVYEEKLNFKKIYNYLSNLSKEKNITLHIKLRKNSFIQKEFLNFAKKNKIELIYNSNLSSIFKKNYDFLFAHNSTLLYESVFYNVTPVRIISKNLFKIDEVDDKFFLKLPLDNYKTLKLIKSFKKKYNIKKLKNVIWKFHESSFPKNNSKKLNEILLK